MKILIIGDSVYPDTMGGSHRHIYDLSKRLVTKGYEVTVYSPKNSANAKNIEVIDGFKVKRYIRRCNKLLSFWDYIYRPYLLFRKDIKEGHLPDIIHGHWPISTFLVFCYVRVMHLPVGLVYTFHGPTVEEYRCELKLFLPIKYLFLFVVKIMECYVLKVSNAIQTASNYMREKEISFYGNAEKISTSYHAVDLNKFILAKETKDGIYPFEYDKKYIFTLRRLKKRMGIQLLLNSFALLVEQHPEYRLLIGGKGDYGEELKKQARELNIVDKTVFLGFLEEEDLKYYYSLSNVCVVPSIDWEGFGLTTVEAMACGTPVVATNVCANTEILCDVTPELLVSQDSKAMAETILKAVDMNKYDGKILRHYVEQRFSWEKTLAAYIKMYQDALIVQ